jgi:hypothetical protein
MPLTSTLQSRTEEYGFVYISLINMGVGYGLRCLNALPSPSPIPLCGDLNTLYMIRLSLTAFTCLLMAKSMAQLTIKRNDIYLEAGGNGLLGSLNYERQLTHQPGLALRLGVGFYTENAFYLTIPVGIHYLFPLSKNRSFIDAGAGVTWTRIDGALFGESTNANGDHFVNFIPSIGFRSHTPKNLMWRISVTPVANKNGLTPWFGASIGKRF